MADVATPPTQAQEATDGPGESTASESTTALATTTTAPTNEDASADADSQALTAKHPADSLTPDGNLILSSTTQEDGTVVQLQQTPAGKKIKKIIRKKRRPARVQVDPASLPSTQEQPAQTGIVFNIWYNKWSGGDSRDEAAAHNVAAATRCVLARDAGYTRADGVPGSFFCMFFARGACPKGRDCDYLHRLPDRLFDVHSGQTDVFGRDKHADYRDDMGGVGSFLRQNRTLYVGKCSPRDDIEEVVARHFSEWGPIERIRVLTGRGVAFVTYATEALAQFAKEAMTHQALDNGEVLNVRWATVDPNPTSQKREARAVEAQAADAIRRVLPPDVVAEIMGDEGAKRRRVEDGSFGLEGYRATDDVWLKATKEKQLGAPAERKLLDDTAGQDAAYSLTGDRGHDKVPKQEQVKVASGLLGSSTLAALKGYDPSTAIRRLDSSTQSTQPLVAYGSDDDDDY